MFLHADSENSDQTGRMPRLICLCWAHSHFVGFVMRRLISELPILCLITTTRIISFILFLAYLQEEFAPKLFEPRHDNLCAQRRLRSAWTSTQSDQSLRYVLYR